MAAPITHSRLHILMDNYSTAFGKSSVVVKTVSMAMILGYICSYFASAIPYITVIPGYVMPPNFRVYSFLCFSFVELHVWYVVADMAVIILFGKLLEPLWGALEMLMFFIIINFGVGVMTTIVYITIYLVTLKEEYLFEVHVHGLSGYMAGLCVAVKQIMPDHCLAVLPFGKIRNTHMPMTLLILIILLRSVGVLSGTYLCMFTSGLVITWVYLRFYQKHSSGIRGDMAENFSLASFLPGYLQPVVTVIANTIFTGLVKLKVCKKQQRKYDIRSTATILVTLPGTESHDTERRKQLALKALNERLNKPDSTLNWPALDDDDDDDKLTSPSSTLSSFTGPQTPTIGAPAASCVSDSDLTNISQNISSSPTEIV